MDQVVESPVTTRKFGKGKLRARHFVRGLIVILAGLLVLYFACAGLSVTLLTIPMRRAFAADPKTKAGLDYQDITFKSRGEDLNISAWFIPTSNSQRAIIFVHGADSCRSCEFGNRALDFARAMHDRGFNTLMLDLRGHGQSDNARITYGIQERHDVEGAVDWLLARGFKPGSIGALGVSLGSSSSLYAAAEEPAIGAIVSDSGYTDLLSIVTGVSSRFSGVAATILPAASLIARLTTGVDVAAVAPIDQIKYILPRPILVIHGGADRVVPPSHALRLATAANTRAWIIPRANHARTYNVAPREYEQRVGDFFNQNLK